MTQPFFITFTGPPERFPALKCFFDRISEIKPRWIGLDSVARDAVINDAGWVDLLDDAALARVTQPDAWDLEDILDCILTGEYDLLAVTFSETGRLEYDPHSFPFGGTDPMRALIKSFGFTVSHDSCYDS